MRLVNILGSILGVCIALTGVTALKAQTAVIPSPNLTAPPPDRVIPEAPIGHRQPRASELPQATDREPSSYQATQDENARQDAALDRKIKGICKGC